MGYRSALEAAGAEVKVIESFSDWNGIWIAKVVFNNETLWISGAFGSRSDCATFQSEFGYGEDEGSPSYKEKLKAFGLYYLHNNVFSHEELLADALKDAEWDIDAQAIVDFLNKEKE